MTKRIALFLAVMLCLPAVFGAGSAWAQPRYVPLSSAVDVPASLPSNQSISTTDGPDVSAPNPSSYYADIFRISVAAAGPLEITMDTGDDLDSYMVLFNASGEAIAGNDDDDEGTLGVGSRINYDVTTPGIYYIVASTFNGLDTGNYVLDVSSTPAQASFAPPRPSMGNVSYMLERDEPFTYQLAGGSGDLPGSALTYSITGGDLPANMTLGPNGLLSGTPTTLGVTTATIQVSDGSGTASGTLRIEIYSHSISGYVRTSNLAPVPDVTMQLSVGGSPTGAPVTTDANGFYETPSLPDGGYTITPSKAGWSFTPPSTFVTISNAGRGVNFIATRTAATYGLSGRIAGSDGQSLSGVSVGLTPATDGVVNPVTTNSAGYYTFTNLPDGSYTITPTRSGTTFAPVSRAVTVAGASQGGLNFVGQTGHKIIGRVLTATGAGVAGVTVTRTGVGATPVTTNSAGYYTFFNVPDGSVTVTPTEAGTIFTPASKVVTVSAADVTGQNFIAATGYTITGRIATSNGTAVPGVDVQIDGGTTVQTNSAGYYTVNNVPNGSHTLIPTKPGYTFLPVQRTVPVNNSNVGGQNFTATLD